MSLQRCRRCGRVWLHYHWEHEAFTRSGRWFRGLITPEAAASLSAETAVETLARLDWHYCGGGYYDGKISKRRGLVDLWPAAGSPS